MSAAQDREAQRLLADRYEAQRALQPPKVPLGQRARNFMEGVGVGAMLAGMLRRFF